MMILALKYPAIQSVLKFWWCQLFSLKNLLSFHINCQGSLNLTAHKICHWFIHWQKLKKCIIIVSIEHDIILFSSCLRILKWEGVSDWRQHIWSMIDKKFMKNIQFPQFLGNKLYLKGYKKWHGYFGSNFQFTDNIWSIFPIFVYLDLWMGGKTIHGGKTFKWNNIFSSMIT